MAVYLSPIHRLAVLMGGEHDLGGLSHSQNAAMHRGVAQIEAGLVHILLHE